jgi:predicted metalloenzyme YecM
MTVVTNKELISNEAKMIDLAMKGGVSLQLGEFLFELVRIPAPDQKHYPKQPYSARVKKHKTLKQRLSEFYGKDYCHSQIKEKLNEVNWGKPIGEEVW